MNWALDDKPNTISKQFFQLARVLVSDGYDTGSFRGRTRPISASASLSYKQTQLRLREFSLHNTTMATARPAQESGGKVEEGRGLEAFSIFSGVLCSGPCLAEQIGQAPADSIVETLV